MGIHPAAADHGIWIKRTDITIGEPLIAARWDNVEQTQLCTKLVNDLGAEVSTVEHVMAALAGCGVHNALIEVDGPEFPILDGSAVPFVRAILGAGVVSLDAPVRAIRILAPVEFKTDQGWARFEPSDAPEMQFAIDFADQAIGKQSKSLNLSNGLSCESCVTAARSAATVTLKQCAPLDLRLAEHWKRGCCGRGSDFVTRRPAPRG